MHFIGFITVLLASSASARVLPFSSLLADPSSTGLAVRDMEESVIIRNDEESIIIRDDD